MAFVAVMVVVVPTACGRDDDTRDAEHSMGSGETDAAPAEDATVTPLAPPAGWIVHSGIGYTIAAPSTFAVATETASNGEPMLVLRAEGSADATVAVTRDVAPSGAAADQARALAAVQRTAGKAEDVRRDEVKWPGSDEAVLVRWTEPPDAASTSGAVVVWQLVAQVSDSLILNVVATAAKSGFDDADVGDVLRTFRPAP